MAKDTRQRIVTAAIDLFSEQGMGNVSLRDIAAAVGIREASLFNHFANKLAILDAVFMELDTHFSANTISSDQMVMMLKDITPQGFVDLSLQRYWAYLKDESTRKVMRIVLMERLINPQANRFFYQFTQNMFSYTAGMFELLTRMGHPIKCDPVVAARMFHAHTLLVMMLAVDNDPAYRLNDAQVEKLIREQAEFFRSVLE